MPSSAHATKFHQGVDGWGRYGDMVCAHRSRNPAFAWALHTIEKRGMRMTGNKKHDLIPDPAALQQILGELETRNGNSFHFTSAQAKAKRQSGL